MTTSTGAAQARDNARSSSGVVDAAGVTHCSFSLSDED